VSELARTGLASPITTSMGRLFDAVAALCGLRTEVNYEGQAAIELEAACDPGERRRHPISLVSDEGGLLVIDPRETISAVVGDISSGVPVGAVASRFHAAIAWATIEGCVRAAGTHGVDAAVLSGGVFQNRRLLEAVATGLRQAGLRVLIPERLPMNDGGVSFGQAAVAARRMELTS
jgi:hydrogenase maturation protein HypF